MASTLNRWQAAAKFIRADGTLDPLAVRLLNDLVTRVGGSTANTNTELATSTTTAIAAAATAQAAATAAQADIDATQLLQFVVTSSSALLTNGRTLAAGTNTTIDTGTANQVKVNVTTFTGLTHAVYAYKIGLVNASENILRVRMPFACSLAASLAGSYGDARVAFTAAKVFDIQKNGSSVGSASFAIAGTTATMSGAGASFAAGDLLTVVGPAVMDVSGADCGISLLFTRT